MKRAMIGKKRIEVRELGTDVWELENVIQKLCDKW